MIITMAMITGMLMGMKGIAIGMVAIRPIRTGTHTAMAKLPREQRKPISRASAR